MSRVRARPLSAAAETAFAQSAEQMGRFFMQQADVQAALKKLARLLNKDDIPYAIVGAMALGQYGYRRATDDVDVLLTQEGLEQFRSRHLGRGYVETHPGSKGMRDTINGVRIDVLVAGDYPGDGKPKPVAFPDPAEVALVGEEFALVPLPTLVELKLASGMSAPHRLRDLADVLELIRAVNLPAQFAQELHPWVRERYGELWEAAQSATG